LFLNKAYNLTDEARKAGKISHGNDGNFVVKVVSLIAGIDHPSVKHANQHILSKTFKDTKLLSATTAKVLISLS